VKNRSNEVKKQRNKELAVMLPFKRDHRLLARVASYTPAEMN